MTDKKYEVRELGQVNTSDFADALGAYDHIKPDTGEDEADETLQAADSDGEEYEDTDTDESDADETEEDSDSEDSEDEDEESEDEEDDEDSEEDSGEVEEDTSEVVEKAKKNLVALTKDGKKIVVPKDAKVKHTVDGKVVELEVHELLNDYAGRQVISRKMNESAQVTKEAQYVKEQAENIQKEYQSFFQEISELTKAGKFDVAVEAIAYANGENAADFMKRLMQQASSWSNTWDSMNEADKARWEQTQQSRYSEKKLKAEQSKLEKVQTEQQAGQYVASLTQNVGIAEPVFFEKVRELAKSEKFSQLDIKGRVDYTVGVLLGEKHVKNIEAVSRSFGNRVTPKLKALVAQHTTYQDSQGDIRKIISALLKDEKSKVAKTLSKKVQGNKTPTVTTKKKGSGADQKQESKVFGNFQDLMDSSY